jgi:hypothetical protein
MGFNNLEFSCRVSANLAKFKKIQFKVHIQGKKKFRKCVSNFLTKDIIEILGAGEYGLQFDSYPVGTHKKYPQWVG